jgi:hypothetical protein
MPQPALRIRDFADISNQSTAGHSRKPEVDAQGPTPKPRWVRGSGFRVQEGISRGLRRRGRMPASSSFTRFPFACGPHPTPESMKQDVAAARGFAFRHSRGSPCPQPAGTLAPHSPTATTVSATV